MRIDFFYFVAMAAPFSIVWNQILLNGIYKAGAGTPWILLHGFPQSALSWGPVLPFLEHYYAIDLPGFGQSEGVTDDLALAAEVVEIIRQHFELGRIMIAGHSMGGYIALEYCKKYGANVSGLAMIHSHPFEDDENRKAKRNQGVVLISNGQKFEFCNVFIGSLFPAEFTLKNPGVISGLVLAGSSLPDTVLSDALIAMRDRVSNVAVLETAGFPVLFVLGELDVAIPLAFALEQTYLPPISTVKIAKGIGHQIMQEAPELLAEYLVEFSFVCNTYS